MRTTNRRVIGVLVGVAVIILAAIAFVRLMPAPVQPTPVVVTPRLVFIPTPETPVFETPTVPVTATETAGQRPGTTWVDLNALAPPGHPRDMLLFECSNCHSFVCALRGQRTLGHWEMVRLTHIERGWVNLPDQDLNQLFDYLELNFNDEKPEPIFPPALADQGCTTPPLR